MLLTIPTDFSSELITSIEEVNNNSRSKLNIGEVYGCLPLSVIGSLRPSSTLPNVSFRGLRKHIDSLNVVDIGFNYTLNSPWLGNIEATRSGRESIVDFLSRIVDCGVYRFTVALPFLARLVKKKWPEVSVSTSIVANVADYHCLRHWTEFGVDRIVVPREKTRDFQFLKKLIQSFDLSVEVLASSPCLLGCPDTNYHGLVSSCESQSTKVCSEPDVSNYGRLNCHNYALSNPQEFIKMPWIRPEDVKLYDRIGVSYLKLDGRDKLRDYNIFRAQQYCNNHFEGNWLHMLLPEYPHTREEFDNPSGKYKYKIYLDNRKLDGFVEATWYQEGCCHICKKCEICQKKANNSIIINKKWHQEMRSLISKEQNNFFLDDGGIKWSYNRKLCLEG
jgi:collagenase-like PrtC family protease